MSTNRCLVNSLVVGQGLSWARRHAMRVAASVFTNVATLGDFRLEVARLTWEFTFVSLDDYAISRLARGNVMPNRACNFAGVALNAKLGVKVEFCHYSPLPSELHVSGGVGDFDNFTSVCFP